MLQNKEENCILLKEMSKLTEFKTDFGKKMEQMQELKGYKVLKELGRLKAVLNIFDKNFGELKKQVKFCETNRKFESRKNRRKLDEAMLELIRFLHNYLSALKTVIDNTQVTRSRLKRLKFNFKEIPEPELHEFIVGLRNFISHYDASNMGRNTHWKEGQKTKRRMFLSKELLLSWSRWTKKPKKFLENYSEIEGFFVLCEEHYNIFRNFNIQFHESIADEYAKELKEFEKFQDNLIEQYPSLRR